MMPTLTSCTEPDEEIGYHMMESGTDALMELGEYAAPIVSAADTPENSKSFCGVSVSGGLWI